MCISLETLVDPLNFTENIADASPSSNGKYISWIIAYTYSTRTQIFNKLFWALGENGNSEVKKYNMVRIK